MIHFFFFRSAGRGILYLWLGAQGGGIFNLRYELNSVARLNDVVYLSAETTKEGVKDYRLSINARRDCDEVGTRKGCWRLSRTRMAVCPGRSRKENTFYGGYSS
jgi:hypothetical protein